MKFTLLELWSQMGVGARLVAGTLILMSLASIVIVVERVAVLLTSNKQSVTFAKQLQEVLGSGDLDRAANASLGDRVGHLGRVLQAALHCYQTSSKQDEDLTFESVTRVLERQAQREVHSMRRGIGVLANVASTAPFVGLLGTTLGIVNSFELMAESGAGGLSTVSAGIAEALTTTALGLLVAIPAVGAYNGLQAWVDARAVDISEASNELLDMVARQLRKTRYASEVRDPSLTYRPIPTNVMNDR